MKKLLTLLIGTSMLVGCTTHTRGINNAKISEQLVEVRPMEASISVGKKMRGKAQCKSLFGFSIESPAKEAYGAELQTEAGNFAPNECTRGAVYNALSKSNADLIIAPQYEVDAFKFLCIPFIDACVYRRAAIDVVGYEGFYKDIKEMDEDVIKTRQKDPNFKPRENILLNPTSFLQFLK